MKTRNRTIAALGAALAITGTASAQALRPVPVYVDGGRLRSDALMDSRAGRTFLPMRTLFESLGARVEWDPSQRAVYAWKRDGIGVRLGVGETVAQTLRMSANPGPGNWGRVTSTQRLDAPAMFMGSRVFVPLRFASEALHADVRYTAYRPAVHISTQAVAGYREEAPGEPEVIERPRRPREVIEEEPPVVVRRPVVVEPIVVEPPVVVRPPRQPVETAPARLAAALELSLDLPDNRFFRDEEVPLRLVVRNRSNRPVVIPFRSGQRFDFEVLQEDRVVWSWSQGRAFTQALTSLTLQPGAETVFTGRWKLEKSNGREVSPGRYLVRAMLTPAFERPQLVVEQAITVKR